MLKKEKMDNHLITNEMHKNPISTDIQNAFWLNQKSGD